MSTDVPALPHQDASLPPGVAAYMIPGNGPEPDEQVTAYLKSGFRIGRLFRPLPVTVEKRR